MKLQCKCGFIFLDEFNGRCSVCGQTPMLDPAAWTHNRFKKGDKVQTEFGTGVVVGIDLPHSRAWRWEVIITDPIKPHFNIDHGKPLAFVDKDVKKVIAIGPMLPMDTLREKISAAEKQEG